MLYDSFGGPLQLGVVNVLITLKSAFHNPACNLSYVAMNYPIYETVNSNNSLNDHDS